MLASQIPNTTTLSGKEPQKYKLHNNVLKQLNHPSLIRLLLTAHLHSEYFITSTLLLSKHFMVTQYYTKKQICDITGDTENPAPPDGPGTDRELIDWLQLQGVDANTIEKVNF